MEQYDSQVTPMCRTRGGDVAPLADCYPPLAAPRCHPMLPAAPPGGASSYTSTAASTRVSVPPNTLPPTANHVLLALPPTAASASVLRALRSDGLTVSPVSDGIGVLDAVRTRHGRGIVTAAGGAFEELERAVRFRSPASSRTPVRMSTPEVGLGNRHITAADPHQLTPTVGATRRGHSNVFVHDHFAGTTL